MKTLERDLIRALIAAVKPGEDGFEAQQVAIREYVMTRQSDAANREWLRIQKELNLKRSDDGVK